MEHRSMVGLLEEQLEEAYEAHQEALLSGASSRQQWAKWFAVWLAPRLVPIMVRLACPSNQRQVVEAPGPVTKFGKTCYDPLGNDEDVAVLIPVRAETVFNSVSWRGRAEVGQLHSQGQE